MGDNEEMEEIKIADVKEEIINKQKEEEILKKKRNRKLNKKNKGKKMAFLEKYKSTNNDDKNSDNILDKEFVVHTKKEQNLKNEKKRKSERIYKKNNLIININNQEDVVYYREIPEEVLKFKHEHFNRESLERRKNFLNKI